jgi:2-polyprenyl-3-methyl-5-hydroxy-6-metoxy-1,4-benzoquinol methylase
MIFYPGNFTNYGQLDTTNSKYITKERVDLLELLPKDFKCNSILEVGCADGKNLLYFSKNLKTNINNCLGIDICKSNLNDYSAFPFEHISIENFVKNNNKKFDLIIFSDVLEHFYNPWSILKSVRNFLNSDGMVLISIPNLQNLNYLKSFNTGEFFYTSTGLFDETHIRFFSTKSMVSYLEQIGYAISNVSWRPDNTLIDLKNRAIDHFQNESHLTISINNFDLHITKDNYQVYFGQQILVSASNGQ